MDYLTASLLSSLRRQDCDKRGENAWTQELDRTARCIKREENRRMNGCRTNRHTFVSIWIFPANMEEARRKADRWIMRNGINDREKLEFALQPSEITFRSQAAWWLSEIASGRLKSRQKNKRGQKIRVSTLDAYTTAVAYLNDKIGDRTLATFDNGEMKELISTMEVETKE